jgi:hypothetical protein
LLIEAEAASLLKKLVVTHSSSKKHKYFTEKLLMEASLLQKILRTHSSYNRTLIYHREVASRGRRSQPPLANSTTKEHQYTTEKLLIAKKRLQTTPRSFSSPMFYYWNIKTPQIKY